MIRTAMKERGYREVPSRRIVNIIKRHGLVDHRVRVCHPSPPPDWYLKDLVSKKAELDNVDIVEKLYLRGGQDVQLFNMISLHGSLVYSVADKVITAEIVIDALMEHWQQFGLPVTFHSITIWFFKVPERKMRLVESSVFVCRLE